MLFKDYYKILGFETNRVSLEQIKNAYREKAKKYHPDRNEGDESTEERFKDINEAYRILSNPSSKRKYDRAWNSNIGKIKNREKNAEEAGTSKGIFGEFINIFFGNKKAKNEEKVGKDKKQPIKGDNIETSINVSIEEAFFGSSKKISLRAVDRKNENIHSKNSSRN